MAMEKLKLWLKTMVDEDGSDLYLSTAAHASAKFHGKLKKLSTEVMTSEQIKTIAYELMDERQTEEFEEIMEMNIAITEKGIGRFRVNIFRQRNNIAMVLRNIATELPNYKDLGLPEILTKIIMAKRGLVLFVGGTGSGKSTSLAALIDYRNINSDGHIITVEDPIEFLHPHKGCIVNQREIAMDTLDYHNALKNTLRQAPDVILIGEIRDAETMEHALAFAETGHLCISTLHANNANQAIDRIINFFPEERHKQIFNDLSLNLQAFISQRLIKTIDNKRAAAIEILLGTTIVQDLIKKQDVLAIKEVMAKSEAIGMQTFDRALFNLYSTKRIAFDEAIANADSPNNLRLMIKLAAGESEDSSANSSSGIELSLHEEESKEDKDSEGSSSENEQSDLGALIDIPDDDDDLAPPPPSAPAPSPPKEEPTATPTPTPNIAPSFSELTLEAIEEPDDEEEKP